MTLTELRESDPLTYDLLIEVCGERRALATVLLTAISSRAGEKARSAEHARVCGHLDLGLTAGLDVAIAAIRSGAELSTEIQSEYIRAARARRETPLRLVSISKGGVPQ